MKICWSIFLFTFIIFHSFGQNKIKRYVKQNLIPVKSIQPEFDDYSDLEEIGKSIGDARVLMLGEQDHGDGASFLAKTRLVKYLHEKKGFNVLAFEGDFFSLNLGWDKTNKEVVSLQEFLHNNLYPYWSRCQQCADLLYTYIPGAYKTNNPLIITGFDNQLYGAFSRNTLKSYITNYLSTQNIAYLSSKNYKDFVVPLLDTISQPWYFSKNPGTYLIANKHEKLKRFEAGIDTILVQLSNKSNHDFEIMLLNNLKALAQESYYYTEDAIATYNIRDAQMANNLEWLVRHKYPNDKVIVWAASSHISKGGSKVYKDQPRPVHWMGAVFTKNSINDTQTYILGFTSKTGTYKRSIAENTSMVHPPNKNGFETWIDDKIPYAFVDFKRFRDEHPGYSEFFHMKGMGHYSEQAVWTNVYDGIFYIRDMAPCGDSDFNTIRGGN